MQNKNYIRRSPDPIFSRPNVKEKIVVWLRETTAHTYYQIQALDKHILLQKKSKLSNCAVSNVITQKTCTKGTSQELGIIQVIQRKQDTV